mmetsp:Transcript_18388/g.22077  ORF Transcript_18388/g.22077 Transcript_18388/m.22077 type:complete len:244 (+) Transcript_18388:232-963(+)|eukprot:CAMPEP_0197844276 /NCGR_PEP_ID=MMETSP1438-20131217/1263_1 /TAXON_ID=1461541 /ORGANISM="Pterosperma sp., Strain CCMP1384" /LENGTH=243 /DNA_ID=CAMNT_0043454979 /DNA_START=220 /DNA_END=951 /DNA_ORIENTATION=+
MSGKAWSLAYTVQKVIQASHATKRAVDAQNGGILDAAKVFAQVISEPATSVSGLRFQAVAPTEKFSEAKEYSEDPATVVIRKIQAPSPNTVFVGDLVVTESEGKVGALEGSSMSLCRVVAQEGDEMISDSSEHEPFHLPYDTVWLLADNEKLSHKDVTDSRTWGPVEYSKIIGRAVYYCRGASEHGMVENSTHGMMCDKAIIDYEVDPQEFIKTSDEIIKNMCMPKKESDTPKPDSEQSEKPE